MTENTEEKPFKRFKYDTRLAVVDSAESAREAMQENIELGFRLLTAIGDPQQTVWLFFQK